MSAELVSVLVARDRPCHRITAPLLPLPLDLLHISASIDPPSAGPVAHFCAQRSDQGWGCGWRNIQIMASHLLLRGTVAGGTDQIMASHLLLRRQEAAGGTEAGAGGREGSPIGATLFGGAGFVPDIGGSGRGERVCGPAVIRPGRGKRVWGLVEEEESTGPYP